MRLFGSALLLVVLNGCADVDLDENGDEIGVVEQSITAGRELRLRRIVGSTLDEGADQIFLTARPRGSSSQHINRPAGDRHYCRLDSPGTDLRMNVHVGTIVASGENLLVDLMEEDDPFSPANLGEAVIFLDGAHAPHFVTTDTVED